LAVEKDLIYKHYNMKYMKLHFLFIAGILAMAVSNVDTKNKTIKIGDQVWMQKNLDVTAFRNGDPIQEATTDEEWLDAGAKGIPAWCYYENDPKNGKKYGRLYNWYAVKDPRGLAPEGFRLPTQADWKQLVTSLGGEETAGLKLKSKRGWLKRGNGNNESNFNGLPAGNRNADGTFYFQGEYAFWWTSTGIGQRSARQVHLKNDTDNITFDGAFQRTGFSVRCIKE
jgi:uncharacterized protein (TIGR02145 family)